MYTLTNTICRKNNKNFLTKHLVCKVNISQIQKLEQWKKSAEQVESVELTISNSQTETKMTLIQEIGENQNRWNMSRCNLGYNNQSKEANKKVNWLLMRQRWQRIWSGICYMIENTAHITAYFQRIERMIREKDMGKLSIFVFVYIYIFYIYCLS